MHAFYVLSSLACVALLVAATAVFFCIHKKASDWWLAAFLVSLVSNTAWAILGPILAGMESTRSFVDAGDLVSRLISLVGYGALLCFAVMRKLEYWAVMRPRVNLKAVAKRR